jgi:hypothetical protein
MRLQGHWWQETEVICWVSSRALARWLLRTLTAYELFDPQDDSRRRVDRLLAEQVARAIPLPALPDKTQRRRSGSIRVRVEEADVPAVALSLAATVHQNVHGSRHRIWSIP